MKRSRPLFREEFGENPQQDIRELWQRALFSCAIGNTDNHMRNQGFLRQGKGWRLSPAFDMNPTVGDNPKTLATGLDFDNFDASPALALDVCDYYRMTRNEGRNAAHEMASVLSGWRKAASACGISSASINLMSSCFESDIQRLAKL